MKREKRASYQTLKSYCRSEGLDTDYFIRRNGIAIGGRSVNKKPWK